MDCSLWSWLEWGIRNSLFLAEVGLVEDQGHGFLLLNKPFSISFSEIMHSSYSLAPYLSSQFDSIHHSLTLYTSYNYSAMPGIEPWTSCYKQIQNMFLTQSRYVSEWMHLMHTSSLPTKFLKPDLGTFSLTMICEVSKQPTIINNKVGKGQAERSPASSHLSTFHLQLSRHTICWTGGNNLNFKVCVEMALEKEAQELLTFHITVFVSASAILILNWFFISFPFY